MTKPEVGAGDVEITLGDHQLVLKPTLQAAISLSSAQGGISTLVNRCLNLEFDALHQVIAAGLGSNSKDLQQLIYTTGMIQVSPVCIKFLTILANGGRMRDEEESEAQETGPLSTPASTTEN